MGGLSSNDSAAKNWLYALAVLFTVLTVAWIVAPSVGPAAEFIRPFAVSVLRSGAPVILFSVVYVLLTVKGTSAASNPETQGEMLNSPPKFIAPPNEKSKWSADIKLSDAVLYLGRQSRWAQDQRYSVTVDKVKGEILAALDSGKIKAWGKAHPDDEQRWQVARRLWYRGDLTLDTNYAFFETIAESGHDMMLSKGELEAAYPPVPET